MKTSRVVSIILALFLLSCSPGLAQQESGERWLLVEVRDTRGRPLKRACVTFVPKEGEIIFRNTDSRGHARLKGPEAMSYRVVVKVDGYEAQKREVAVGSQSETVAFTMQPRENHR
jgi:hypothetical protein